MSKFIAAVFAFLATEDGVTSMEYALIAALIGVAAVVGANTLGATLNNFFNGLANALPAIS